MERLRIMRGQNECRCGEDAGQCGKKRTGVPWWCRAVVAAGTVFPMRVRLVAAGHSLAATDCRALAGVGSSAGVRNGVHGIFRVPQKASPKPSR